MPIMNTDLRINVHGRCLKIGVAELVIFTPCIKLCAGSSQRTISYSISIFVPVQLLYL